MRLVGCVLVVLGCSGDENTTPRIGFPETMSAYVLGSSLPSGCDLGDPRSWGGNFTAHARCVPDLLNPADQGMTFAYDAILRVVFNEGVQDSLIQSGGMLAINVVETLGVSLPVPIDTARSHYDPAGADFKQGIDGTAPPGPAIVVTPGDGYSVMGLPSGQTTKICFNRDMIRDVAGARLRDLP